MENVEVPIMIFMEKVSIYVFFNLNFYSIWFWAKEEANGTFALDTV